jgi:hypothetical protein
VNVAQNQYAHESPNEVPIIDQGLHPEWVAKKRLGNKMMAEDSATGMAIEKQRAGWRFKGKTPLWFKLVAGLLITDAAAHISLSATVAWWASRARDAAHMRLLPFRDGVVYFVSPEVGWYLSAWWISIALFLLLAGLLVVNRDQLERTV